MKRSIAMALVLVMVLAMVPAANAAATDPTKLEIRTADVLELTSAPNRYEALAAQSEEPYTCWVLPYFEIYGKAAVIGRTLSLNYWVNGMGLGEAEGYAGVQIFKGTYESLTDDSQPVASHVEEVSDYPAHNLSYGWKTKGCKEGDYTALFFVADANLNVVAASAADLYLSKKEIPLSGIDIYVYELDDTPDEMYTSLDSSGSGFSVGIIFEPYHTTVDRYTEDYSGGMLGFGGSNKADMSTLLSIIPPFDLNELWDPMEYTVKYTGAGPFASGVKGCEDTIRVEFKYESEVVHFPGSMKRVCLGEVYEIPVTAPEGTGEIMVMNGNPYALEILDARDGVITVRALTLDRSELSVCADGAWDRMEIWPQREHDWRTEVRNPTCTEDGYSRKVCDDCGMISDEVIKSALGHDVAEVVVLSEPTATKDGLSAGYCSRCEQNVELPISRIFTDTQPDWFYSDALDYCYEKGIINGLSATTFGPGATLNRAQLVTMLYRHAGSPEVEGENLLTDVPEGQFYTNAVIWASINGIVNGYEDGSFRPGKEITRQEIVTMLHRYVVSLGKDNGERSDLAAFTDLDQLMGYAADAMQWAVANGIINGISETQLGPQQSANRAQTVTIFYRIITGTLGE